MAAEALRIYVNEADFAVEAVELVVEQLRIRVAQILHANDPRRDVGIYRFTTACRIARPEPLLARLHCLLTIETRFVGDDQIPTAGVGGFEDEFVRQVVP